MFTPKQRKIYKFNNGSRDVARDPQKLLRRMEVLRPDNYPKLVEALKSGDVRLFSPAVDVLLPWISNVFDVPVFTEDGEGLLEHELFDLLRDFMDFVKEKKDDTGELPNNLPSSPESTPSEAESLPTPPTSDSGSTE